MELIVRRIYEVFEAPSGKRMAKITTSDRERIHEARDILTGNLENPPTLTELSRRVGINTTKLKRGFRQIYGISPYALLRRERLRLACRLLGDKHPNITEISHHLGYCDTSHFIREFSKQYGTSPGRYAKTLSP
jgi:AraC-like DNA-binding protein